MGKQTETNHFVEELEENDVKTIPGEMWWVGNRRMADGDSGRNGGGI